MAMPAPTWKKARPSICFYCTAVMITLNIRNNTTSTKLSALLRIARWLLQRVPIHSSFSDHYINIFIVINAPLMNAHQKQDSNSVLKKRHWPVPSGVSAFLSTCNCQPIDMQDSFTYIRHALKDYLLREAKLELFERSKWLLLKNTRNPYPPYVRRCCFIFVGTLK